MTEQIQTPLIGPLRRRGWREIVRVRPLSNIPHVALVITRQGRLAGVIPANDRRVLSDYITWPYEFREVDMRERSLLVRRRVESCDAGYEFDATFKLTYQVERPERVALELEDALAELENALAQSMRVTSRSFGVEQATALEENLREALLYGDVLRERLEALGLGLRRADVAVELDNRARMRAEGLREHMRERPLLAHLAIESLEPTISFDVLVGGSYRLTSRTLTIVAPEAPEAHDAALQEAIARTLQRIGILFAPQDYVAAARAMAEALRQDALLQTVLSATEIELVRPTVKIQPDRQMIVAAQSAAQALSTQDAPERTRRAVPLLTEPVGPTDELDDTPSWAALGAMFGREVPRALPAPTDMAAPSAAELTVDGEPIAEAEAEIHSDPTPSVHPAMETAGRESEIINIDVAEGLGAMPDEQTDGAWRAPTVETSAAGAEENLGWIPPSELVAEADIFEPAADAQLPEDLAGSEQDSDESFGWLAPLPEGETRATLEPEALPWALPGDTSQQTETATTNEQPAPPAAITTDTPATQLDEPPVDKQRIAHWIALLQADDPALFKLWSMELMAQPAALPTILSALVSDSAAMDGTDDPRYQQALVDALTALRESRSQMMGAKPSQPALDDDPAPDWLSLRRMGQEEMRDD